MSKSCFTLLLCGIICQVQAFSFMKSPMISKSLNKRGSYLLMPARLDDQEENVNVFEVKNVDAVNLTVLGFGM